MRTIPANLCAAAAAFVSTLAVSGAGKAVTLPPPTAGDGLAYFGFQKPFIVNNRGENFDYFSIQTPAPNGTGIAFYGTEMINGVPTSVVSDYLYVFNGHIAGRGDTDTGLPGLPKNINPANFVAIKETGKWQRVDQYLGFTSPMYFYSSIAVPEPASWALMLIGAGTIGGLVRRRRVFFSPL